MVPPDSAATLNSSAPSSTPAAPLDEVMLAMDVVDTLRHREHLVKRELGEGARAGSLIDRLKDIYAAQGIEVPEHILTEGVEALKRDRFVYTPPEPSLSVSLAHLYVKRGLWTKIIVGGLAALLIAWFGYQALVVWPQARIAEAVRVELQETLPKSLTSTRDQVIAEAQLPSIDGEAEALYQTGIAAAKTGDRDTATTALTGLNKLHRALAQSYEMRIVSRQGEQSGVWRIPDANTRARNYYLIVEAIDKDGKALELAIRNEENGRTTQTNIWGVRVSKVVFDGVRRDKSDDGIIQNNVVAIKSRGLIDPDYKLPTLGGAITEW